MYIFKSRLCRDREQSLLLKLKGYKPETCTGKCIVRSKSLGPTKAFSRVFIIKDLIHKCEKAKG